MALFTIRETLIYGQSKTTKLRLLGMLSLYFYRKDRKQVKAVS